MKKFERKAQSQRKHGPLSVSSASKAPVAPPIGRPGWTGPGYIKKVPRQPRLPTQDNGPRIQEQTIPFEIQQLILDVYRATFPASNEFDALKPVLREIRDAVTQRDFEKAFGTEELLEAYTIRWSPSKSLAYSNILAWICSEVQDEEWVKRCMGDTQHTPANVLCFSRGAAELMAFAALLKHLRPSITAEAAQSPLASPEIGTGEIDSLSISVVNALSANVLVNLCLADTTNWSTVTSKLHHSLITPPTLSKYASAKARALNSSVLSPQALDWRSPQIDILECGTEELRSMIGPDPTLLTLFHTLSEFYLTSIPKTTAFLLKLTAAAPKGSLLLVVDSPGVYSTIPADNNQEGQEKKYPIHWLMYQALLPRKKPSNDDSEEEEEPAWGKLVEDDDSLFKLPGGLKFPVSLENMQFQVHLLKRL